jgi:hypothetical protein
MLTDLLGCSIRHSLGCETMVHQPADDPANLDFAWDVMPVLRDLAIAHVFFSLVEHHIANKS